MANTVFTGSISATQMQAAIAAYLTANPVKPAAPTQAQVDAAVATYLKANPPTTTPPPTTPPTTPPVSKWPAWSDTPPAGKCAAPTGPMHSSGNGWDHAPLVINEIWDHFDGPAGPALDSRLWNKTTVNQGGAQTYQQANAFLDGNSHAVLRATGKAGAYVSGRFDATTKWNIQYGYLAARIKFPNVGGSLPAWWTLMCGWGTGVQYGEIDIMELFGTGEKLNTTLHLENDQSATMRAVANTPWGVAGNDYHTYWMRWEAEKIVIGADDLTVGTFTPTQYPAKWKGFQQPAYCLLNFAVGGFSWIPGSPDAALPADMAVDWVWYKPLSLMT